MKPDERQERRISIYISPFEVWKLAVAGTLGVLTALSSAWMLGELVFAALKWVGMK